MVNNVDEGNLIYWVLSNCNGMDDLDDAKFVERLKTTHVAHANGDDGAKVESKTIEAPYEGTSSTIDMLKKKGYEILEIPSRTEQFRTLACNFVALEPNHILMAQGNPRTQEMLDKHGVNIDTVDISEILKGRGSLHCITAFLKRG